MLRRWLGKRLNTRGAGSFSFQNAFFYLQWPDDPLVNKHGLDSRLLTARKTTRRVKLHPHKQRSKYICRPEFVVSPRTALVVPSPVVVPSRFSPCCH